MATNKMFKPQTVTQRIHFPDKFLDGEHCPEYLEIFGSENASKMCLHDSDKYEALCAWNKLQRTPSKRRNFTFTVFDTTFSVIKPYVLGTVPKWAYILHDKDDAKNNHYHLYVEYENPRSFASVANDLHIPVNQLQGVISKKGILSYLTHDNEPDKYHYDLSEVESNFDIVEEKTEPEVDVMAEALDYYKMRMGQMTYTEFLERHATSNI